MKDENKTCVSCKESKPRTSDFFYYRNKPRGWFSSWCKACRTKKRQETRLAENKTQRARRRRVPRYCSICAAVRVPLGKKKCDDCLRQKIREAKRRDKCLYRSRLRKACPPWADRQEIRKIYTNCPEGMVVDHIIPLRGKGISGLHVPGNLQYLTNEDNMKKGNKWGGRK